MAKSFVVLLVFIAIVAFSVSAFMFSDNNITLSIPAFIQSGDLDRQAVINEIDRCVENNLNGHMSIKIIFHTSINFIYYCLSI